jgi:RNA polymerase sigma-70 factor (ECF subfamily)
MAHNKVVSKVRFHARERRDVRRVESDGAERLEWMAAGDDPARVAAGRELLGAVRAEMIDEERAIADLRGQGCTWPEVAQRLGGTAEARRKQFGRTLDRVAAKLGLDEESLHDDHGAEPTG